MLEPEWVQGDDFARGYLDECPRCEGLSLVGGSCEECGYNAEYDEVDPYGDYSYDDYMEDEAYYGND